MIIRKLALHHFLTYHGDQEIEIPTGERSSLTIIVGPNNSGKTSIVRALKFWFYGEKGVPKKEELPLYLNIKAKDDTEVGKSLEAWVEVTFEHETNQGKETTILRRTLSASRVSQDRWEVRSVSLRQILPRARPDNSPEAEKGWQRLLEGLMPKPLFDAFYFKGEPLDGRLLGDVTSIRQALGLFLHEEQWKEAEVATAKIRDQLDRDLSGMVERNAELQNVMAACHNLEQKLDSQEKALEIERGRQADLEAEESKEANNLTKLGDEATAKEAKLQLDRARQLDQRANDRLVKINAEIAQAIGSSSGLAFLRGAVAPVRTILSEMERENILPADISEGFIDRVLARSSCICGHQHDQRTRDAWENYRKKTLAADVNEGLSKLLNWVKPEGHLSVERRAAASVGEISQLLEDRRDAVEQVNAARSERIHAENALSSVPHEEIARIGMALRRLREDIRNADSRIHTIQKAVTGTEQALKKQKETLNALSANADVNHREFQDRQQARDRADRLHKALTLCRGRLGRYFHQVLQADVSASYDSKATDGSSAQIDRHSLLPSIHVRGQRMNNLGGGQSQLLALAYVVALARLRQNMHAQMEELGVRLGKINDLSFFMDSPLGNMEEHYKRAAAVLAPGSAKQVVMLLWREEWDFVRPLLEAQSDAIYAIEFHTRTEDFEKLDEGARIYGFEDGSRQLICQLPEGDNQPRSKLIKIK